MRPAVSRRIFISKFMESCGLTYEQASSVYVTMCDVLEDAIVAEHKIGFGRVGAITPYRRAAQVVTMGCLQLPGRKTEKVRRQFFLDARTQWKFKLYRKFEKRRQLR